MNFINHGFKTGEVILPGIDILVRLSGLEFFRDDGIVPDVNAHMGVLSKEFGYKLPKNIYHREIYNKETAARHVLVMEPDDIYKGCIIFIQDQGTEVNSFNRGHESTHVAVTFGLKDEFNGMLNHLGFFLDPFSMYKRNEEKIANIGGLMSAYRHGHIDYFASEAAYPSLFPLYQDLIRSKRP
ncbi:MAG: hypothetical protein NDI94_01550 [Candidatus Woesearchaeota archaeon]|nr:hypothetical protein [Candidatus Woesearchaeota archaeon]